MKYRDDEYDLGDDEADLADREAPDPADTDGDDGADADVMPCPFCGRDMYDGADVCPHCGNFVSAGDAPRRLPLWFAAGAAACLLILLVWAVTRHG